MIINSTSSLPVSCNWSIASRLTTQILKLPLFCKLCLLERQEVAQMCSDGSIHCAAQSTRRPHSSSKSRSGLHELSRSFWTIGLTTETPRSTWRGRLLTRRAQSLRFTGTCLRHRSLCTAGHASCDQTERMHKKKMNGLGP